MGKDGGFMTAKAIGNRIKAKGLQKLRWYCQMCEKQCRDENGFKCHCNSEAHQRQMQVFAQKPGSFMERFSREFETGFIDILSRRHGTKKILANRVYNEFIADKGHTHMNGTQWTSLTGFLQHLARAGKITLEETERGWFVQWIDRDPAAIERQKALEKKHRQDNDDEERQRRFLQQQIQAAGASGAAGATQEEEAKEFVREDPSERISVNLGAALGKKKKRSAAAAFAAADTDGDADEAGAAAAAAGASAPVSAAEQLMQEGLRRKQERERREEQQRQREREAEERAAQRRRRDDWVVPGIVVKVLSKSIGGGEYYKLKGTITEVQDTYIATVEMRESGDVLRLDQRDLETVVPAAGGEILMVNGRHRGRRGTLESMDIDNFCATLRLSSPSEVLERVPYEDFSRAA